MNEEQQLELQAFLDGELSEREARAVAERLARDPEATALLDELRNTRRALKDSEPELRVPASREFYWSKIRRDIERLEEVAAEPSVPISWHALLRRLLIPAGAVAAVALVVVLAALQTDVMGTRIRPNTEVANADADTFTYDDYANGTTLVWLDYPAER